MDTMIVSASRRTDIPAFYGEWFSNRLRAGWCRVPNPFNPRQVATVSLAPEDVHAFVFWTRDPRPFLPVLDVLDRRGFAYIFLFTLTGYGLPLEAHGPDRDEAIQAFRRLADRLGPERVLWRYDPVILGPGLQIEDHIRRFTELTQALEGSTETVKLSFLDLYRKTRRRVERLPHGELYLGDPTASGDLCELLQAMGEAASASGMTLETCAEDAVAETHGLRRGRCVDPELLKRLFGVTVSGLRDRGQRRACGCAVSRDIGMNDSCLHGCSYCYATSSHQAAAMRRTGHDPASETML